MAARLLTKLLSGSGLAAILILLITACAPITRVVLLPQADGSVSSVLVKSAKSEQILNTPYQSASGQENASLKLGTTTEADVMKGHPDLFSAMPPRPSKYTLNFMPGGTVLTPESQAALPKIMEDVTRRRGADLVVTGHTDTMGALLANDELSLKRAQAVAQLLVSTGAPESRTEAVGRGKRELLVKTADEVDEPQNRRVEILVR